MQRLLLLGLNHTTAPLAVREKLAFAAPQARAAVGAFRERFPTAEAVLLSTCNRVELYVGRQAHAHLGLDELVGFLSDFHALPADQFRDHLYHTAGPLLNPLFQRAVAVGKQVMHETALAEGRRSVASVAVDYARRIFEHFSDKTVLSIGAGKMAALVLQHFVGLSPRRLLVCNRDADKARDLAGRFGGEAVPFERLNEHLVAADIVVSGTGASQPI